MPKILSQARQMQAFGCFFPVLTCKNGQKNDGKRKMMPKE
jgi:hypothetical protein